MESLENDGFADFSVLMHCAVYALVRRGVVIYIGQSKSVGERTQSHIRLRRKSQVKRTGLYGNRMFAGIQFDAIWIRKCMLAELNDLEREMIQKYQPRYNQRHKNPPPIALAELMKTCVALRPTESGGFRRRA